jgi:hypothetical protein
MRSIKEAKAHIELTKKKKRRSTSRRPRGTTHQKAVTFTLAAVET